MSKGKLTVCPTPIGNLEDITFRTLKALKNADIIIAEDTRHTVRLLNHFEISKPLTSYHAHNEKSKSISVIERLIDGEKVALVSDAGMPGISDPGAYLIKACIKENIDIEVLPGSTAGIVALVGSGLCTERFAFEGFLGHQKKKRIERLEQIKYDDRTLIFYEAPHRIKDTLEDMLKVLGNRYVSVARELTKKYEEFVRGSISEVLLYFREKGVKGELVIILEGSDEVYRSKEDDFFSEMSIKEHISYYISQGTDKKEAIKKVAEKRKLPKREVYKESIDI
ncbi:16S rRNA (cytidine(1402)-2'-O)-methyltransferase [Serpentinicella sp. ANB-PHB4]|uniref:16S rRNA (cytidine(1402)-2'-O)-methyltransferase n=1 Tax=Serpentinicella sp. ANB-PHB4 TaxID=3074076 RepID=UPI002857E4ED|nr:16S rRNA (cytidine(1402)-2'-O)-methyltransferase [Serpentinicella sp. ANB-PHB4]MDR5659216.1 16S rRNA (cytidine(1402)-2'-O)-methyltransferase [Serpentinicella sp. ANB-PHB4]